MLVLEILASIGTVSAMYFSIKLCCDISEKKSNARYALQLMKEQIKELQETVQNLKGEK